MSLSPRYILNILTVVAAAFVTVASLAFPAHVASWIGFGVSTGLLVLAGAGLATAKRLGQRVGHGATATVALWSLIAALVFSGHVLTWLVFADAVALVAVGLADLTAHEATTERVVHELDVSRLTTPTAKAA